MPTLLAVADLSEPGKPLQAKQIVTRVWGDDRSQKTIRRHVRDLRGYGAIGSRRTSRGYVLWVRPVGEWCGSAGDLVLAHQDLVERLARQCARFLPAWVPLDEHIQNGQIGLLRAAERYDRLSGIPFSAYAVQRVRGAIIDQFRRGKYTAELGVEVEPSHERTYRDTRGEDAIERRDAREWLELALDRLTPPDADACRTLLTGESLSEFGARYGLKRSGASLRRTAAVRKLRLVMEEMGLSAGDFLEVA